MKPKPQKPQKTRKSIPRKALFVVYQSCNETLVTTPTLEKKAVKEWFVDCPTRKLSEFDRGVVGENAVWLRPSNLRVINSDPS